MIFQKKRIIGIVLIVVFQLLIPVVAMQLTDEVNWSLFDFIVMGALLLTTGLACEFALGKIKKVEYRIFILIVIIAAFLLIWAELAVGVFGTPFGGN